MLVLALSSSLALADIPPPEDYKVQRYEIEFTGLDAHPDFAVVVFPYSTSNGRPDAAAEVVKAGVPIELGGRIMGTPHVWLAPAATAAETAATLTAAAREDWDHHPDPASLGLVSCGVDLTDGSKLVPKAAPDVEKHTIALVEASAAGCKLDVTDLAVKPPEPAVEPVVDHGAHGCTTVAAWGASWGLLLAAGALIRRR